MNHISIPISSVAESGLNKKTDKIMRMIERIFTKHGVDDKEWAQAISSQYFLLCLAKDIQSSKKIYHQLLDKCLSSFSVTYKGDYVLDKNKLLITPDETSRIAECMKREDEEDDYFTHSAKLRAENIDTHKMYMNFHYGLLLRIVAAENTEILRVIKYVCLDKLLNDNALDDSDGWYPYRVPWLTARVLISLKHTDYKDYSKAEKLDDVIRQAIESIYRRFDDSELYWRSGVGKWVSKWESTALCLEALYLWENTDLSNQPEVSKAIGFIFAEKSLHDWLEASPNFKDEESSNDVLSSICLASVVYRITKRDFKSIHEQYRDRIIDYFLKVLRLIEEQKVIGVRQYCTIPQILYYIVSAIQDKDGGEQ